MLKLRLLTGPRAGRQLRVSDTKPVSIGRRVGRLRLHDSRVSKKHAKVFFAGGAWVLRDLGSANGTFVNRRRCEGLVELETGDILQMGRVLIKVLQADAVGMDATRGLPGVRGVGVDAFTASGATGQLPAIDPGKPVKGKANEIDLAELFGEDAAENDDDDLLDLSDMSRAGGSQAGMSAAGQTAGSTQKASAETIHLESVDDDDALEELDSPSADERASDDSATRDRDQADALLAAIQADADASDGDLLAIAEAQAQAEEEADDDKPELVGLRLGQRPPQQPNTAAPTQDTDEVEDALSAIDAELDLNMAIGDEVEAEVEALAQIEPADELVIESVTELADDVEEDIAAEVEIEPVAAEPAPVETAPTPPVVADPAVTHRESDASLTDLDEPAEDAFEDLDLETARAELAFEEVTDIALDPVDAKKLAEEFWADDEADAEAESEIEVVAEAEPAIEAEVEAEAGAESAPEIEAEVEAAVEAVDVEAEVEPDSEPTPTVSEQGESLLAEMAEQEKSGEASDEFDIDAAFEALSEGLDDSLSMPALTDGAEPAEADQAQPVAEADEAEPLAGSQLDISFIRDALARLGDEDANAPAEPAAKADDSASARQHAAAPIDADAVADELDADALAPVEAATRDTLDEDVLGDSRELPTISTAPGLNPMSLLPPGEPNRSHRPRKSGKRKWFLPTLALVGVVLGIGGYIAYSIVNADPIAGRTTEPAGTNPPAVPNPAGNNNPPIPTPGPGDSNPVTDPPQPDPQTPQTVDPDGPETTDPIAGAAPPPDPFAQGPGVIGRSALIGVTDTGSGDSTALPGPGTNRPSNPGVVEPTLPGTEVKLPDVPEVVFPPKPDNTDPTTNPGDGTATGPINPPIIPDPVAPNPNPSRIVFLVDASGSLVDTLPQMLIWLDTAIQTIGPDEQFAIVFFKAGKAIETDPAGLQKPTRRVLDKLSDDWLDPKAAPVLPAGRSDPSKAIELALRYNPTDVYLLSDESFARYAGDTTRDEAVKLVTDALGDTKVRLHGVQFFYRDAGGVLETLANRYDGTFEFVKENAAPAGDTLDLLNELEENQ